LITFTGYFRVIEERGANDDQSPAAVRRFDGEFSMEAKLALFVVLLFFAVTNPVGGEMINFSTASDSGNRAPLWIAADLGF
jgi:hypothetical protein